jgi:hypothetical protein
MGPKQIGIDYSTPQTEAATRRGDRRLKHLQIEAETRCHQGRDGRTAGGPLGGLHEIGGT